MPRTNDPDDYFLCPHCGAELPAGAEFCRNCGASEEAGWNEAGTGEDDEADDFDYDDFLRREFPEHAPPRAGRQQAKRLAMWIVVLLVCAAFLVWTLFARG